MLVNGGRSGWRAAPLALACSALSWMVAACGSRTSMLDSDAYSSIGGGFGNVAGSSNAAGSSSTGGGNAVDPNRSAQACEKYCKGYRTYCSDDLGGRDCSAACAQEVNNQGQQCQTLGIAVLECLAPHFSAAAPVQDCASITARSTAACSAELAKFAGCRDDDDDDDPSPMPNPNPVRPRPSDCRATGMSGGGTCVQIYECTEGPYLVQCTQADTGNQDCVCIPPSGAPQLRTYRGSLDACTTAAMDCGFF
jgi:hypothetical protein